MKKIGCTSLVPDGNRFVAVACSKKRGIILPGGKWEKGESFKECAKRELFEETGLIAMKQQLIFSGLNTDGYFVYVFLTEVDQIKYNFETSEGVTLPATWDTLQLSDFGPFYELVQDSLENRSVISEINLNFSNKNARDIARQIREELCRKPS